MCNTLLNYPSTDHHYLILVICEAQPHLSEMYFMSVTVFDNIFKHSQYLSD